jgi:chromosome segregation ATPase
MINLAEWVEGVLRSSSAQDVTNLFLFILVAVFTAAIVASLIRRWHAFVHYAPNLLTTLGILGTFIGIVIGLLDFKVASNAEIQASIGPLLEGLKTAFITSLAGMTLAIAFKVLESTGWLYIGHKEEIPDSVGPEDIHAELQQQRKALEKLAHSIAGEEDATLISQIRLLRSDQRDALKEQKDVLSKQAEYQELIAKVAKHQVKRFDEFNNELWKKLDDFAEMLSKSATEQVISALKEVISDFNKNLTEQFGENFKELNAAVAKLVEWQENYRQQLSEMREQYAQGVQAITTTEASVAKISEESQQIPVAMGELKTVLTTTQHQLDELQRHLEAFRDMRDRAVEAVPQIQAQMDAMAKDVATAAKDAGEQIMTASQAVNLAIVEGAKEFEDRVNRTNEGLVSASDQLANNSEKIREQLQDTVSDINAQVREMVAAVRENTEQVGQTFTEANRNLESNIKEVQYQVTDSIETMQKRLEKSLEEVFQQQSNALGKTFNAMDDEVRKVVGTTGEAVNKQLEAMDSAMQQELERVITVLGQQLAAITRRFTDDYSALTEQMAEVVGQARRFGRGDR